MKKALHLLLVVVLFSAACGDEGEVAHVAAPVPDERVEPETPEPPMGLPYVIEAVDTLPLTANALTTAPIRAVLRTASTGAPVSEEMLKFELVQAADTISSLDVMTSVTQLNGEAAANLRLGPGVGTAVVVVSHPEAEDLEIDIHVGEPLAGTIRVDIVDPTTTLDISPYRISVYDLTEVGCNDFVPRTRPAANPVHEMHVATSDPAEVQPVLAGEYTVVAEALGENGLILAGGCKDFVEVMNARTTAITIPLELYPVNPSGTYEVNGEWDIAAAVSASNDTAGVLVNVIDFMANPGASIYNLVLTYIEDAVDFPIGILLGITGVQQQIITTVNDALFQFAPIATFSAVANDLSNMLHHLNVTSILTIEKTDTEFAFRGHEEWTTLTVDWTWRCQQNPAQQNCQQYTVDLQGSGAAAATVSYEWTGYVDGYDQLVVGSHNVLFDIGRLQLYLLEQVIIPDLTGGNANSLAGAFAYWVDCDGLAQQALGGNDICDPSGIFCLGDAIIESACVAAVTEVADFVTGPILNQPVVADMVLAGKATLIDGTPNGIADELHDGRTEGTLQNSTETVTANWNAVRVHAAP